MPVHNVFPHGLPAGAPQDLLAAIGLLLAVEINVPQSLANVLTSQGAALPQPVTGSALVDTGATSCCVEESLVQGLGLQPVGQVHVCGQSGLKLQNVYLARMSFPGSPMPTLELPLIGVQMTGQNLISPIGRDVLRHCVLVYNGPMGSYTIAF